MGSLICKTRKWVIIGISLMMSNCAPDLSTEQSDLEDVDSEKSMSARSQRGFDLGKKLFNQMTGALSKYSKSNGEIDEVTVVDKSRVLILVDFSLVKSKSVYKFIKMYNEALNSEGLTSEIAYWDLTNDSKKNPENVKEYLKSYYSKYSEMSGAIFVGNFPALQFYYDYYKDSNTSGTTWYLSGAHTTLPTDLYYMDLNGGDWSDSDGDGVYDTITDYDIKPAIWVSRIDFSKISSVKSQAEALVRYFARNINFRSGNSAMKSAASNKALNYIDDDWSSGNAWHYWGSGSAYAYEDLTEVRDKETTKTSNYKSQLTAGYEWISLAAHGYWQPSMHAFTSASSDNAEKYFYSTDIPASGMTAAFFNLWSCWAGKFTITDSLAQAYLSKGNTLAVIASAKAGAMMAGKNFSLGTNSGSSIGDSFVTWSQDRLDSSYERLWHFGLNIRGDGTLKLSRFYYQQ